MVRKLSFIKSDNKDPYENLALESVLLDSVEEGELIFYLWQNQNTVVIGKNQNAWKECALSKMAEDGIRLARRLSGGGAVFHDLGNLNFTFLLRREDYDLLKQTKVILEGVKKAGIKAEPTGRNDITVDSKKFSGNAFYFKENVAYHHGTVLISADLSRLANYLNVSLDKMQGKGIDSVRSRVVNLNVYKQDLTIEKMQQFLLCALEEVYGLTACERKITDSEKKEMECRRELYSSENFLLGENVKFEASLSGRFPWGGIEILFSAKSGVFDEVKVYSDALDDTFPPAMEGALLGLPFSKEQMTSKLSELKGKYPQEIPDILNLILSSNF